MTTKQIVENVTAWVDANICKKIELKVPDDYQNGDEYSVKTVNPAAFPLFVPAKDRLAPNIAAPIPSVCVQMMEGSDDVKEHTRSMKLRLCLSAWNPGKHAGETLIPIPDPDAVGGYRYKRADPREEEYERNADGWKDLYNFQDIALRALESGQIIAGVRIDSGTPITYGPFTEDGLIWDYYPYWHGWVAFSVVCGLTDQKPDAYGDLL